MERICASATKECVIACRACQFIIAATCFYNFNAAKFIRTDACTCYTVCAPAKVNDQIITVGAIISRINTCEACESIVTRTTMANKAVIPYTCVEYIAAGRADQCIRAIITKNRIGIRAACNNVIATTRLKDFETGQIICADACAGHRTGCQVRCNCICLTCVIGHINTATSADRVITAAVDKCIVARSKINNFNTVQAVCANACACHTVCTAEVNDQIIGITAIIRCINTRITDKGIIARRVMRDKAVHTSATIKCIAAGRTDQCIRAIITKNRIGIRAACNNVIATTRLKDFETGQIICADACAGHRTGCQVRCNCICLTCVIGHINTATSADRVITAAVDKCIVARSKINNFNTVQAVCANACACHAVCTAEVNGQIIAVGAIIGRIRICATDKCIVACRRITDETICAAATEESIAAGRTDQRIRAAITKDRIGIRATCDDVIAGTEFDHFEINQLVIAVTGDNTCSEIHIQCTAKSGIICDILSSGTTVNCVIGTATDKCIITCTKIDKFNTADFICADTCACHATCTTQINGQIICVCTIISRINTCAADNRIIASCISHHKDIYAAFTAQDIRAAGAVECIRAAATIECFVTGRPCKLIIAATCFHNFNAAKLVCTEAGACHTVCATTKVNSQIVGITAVIRCIRTGTANKCIIGRQVMRDETVCATATKECITAGCTDQRIRAAVTINRIRTGTTCNNIAT